MQTLETQIDNLEAFNAKVSKFENQLFDVITLPLLPIPVYKGKKFKFDSEGKRIQFNNPTHVGIYKSSGGNALGVVGKVFNPIQPKMLFSELADCLYENKISNIDKLQYSEFKDGSKIMFKIPIKTMSFTNLRGKIDETDMFLNLCTGFDGMTKTTMSIGSYRLICLNGMRGYKTEFAVSFKNAKGNNGKALNLIADIKKGIQGIDTFGEFLQELNSKKVVNKNVVNGFVLRALGYQDKVKEELSNRSQNIIDKLHASIELEFNRTGASLFGLLNGVTHYTNHIAEPTSLTREEFINLGTGASLNDRAQELVSEMAKKGNQIVLV